MAFYYSLTCALSGFSCYNANAGVQMILKRKIYNKLLEWKKNNGKRALLIEGARRVGKSTIVEEFGKNEYRSYLLIDFSSVSAVIKNAFENYLSSLDTFFMILSAESGIHLYERDSLIIFDEVQKYPKAREAIKHLVKDGRYDYIETGSLISIKENVSSILIPSEERSLKMYPLDFEEFMSAMGEDTLFDYIKDCFSKRIPLERELHNKAMLLLRQYMIVGGMPMSVIAYLENNLSFAESDMEKRDILKLWRSDIMKIRSQYRDRVLIIFDQIPALLSNHNKKIQFSNLQKGSDYNDNKEAFFWLSDSMITNECTSVTDPNVGFALTEKKSDLKCYLADTGLLLSQAFSENEINDNNLYREILFDKLSINEGMFIENLVAQMLTANGHELYFYMNYNLEKHRTDIEIDFLLSSESKINHKIIPIEVKSTENYRYVSLSRFSEKFKNRIGNKYILHPKNLTIKEDGTICLPLYMTCLL